MRSTLAVLPVDQTAQSSVEAIDESLDITAGKQTIRAQRVARIPLAQGVLVAHVPSDRTIIESDLYSVLSPFNATSDDFGRWLMTNHGNVNRVVGIHHGLLSMRAKKSPRNAMARAVG